MTSTTESPRTPVAGDRYPWVVMAIVLAGTYLVVLDTTVLGVALAAIADDLHAERTFGIEWVVTAYLIAVGIVQPATAWMSERFGRKRVFVASLFVFTLASLAAGVAPTMPTLVLSRLLQGLGGGAMMPVGMAMVWDQFPPHRRGVAMSVHGVAVMAAPAFGPVVGGWMVTSLSWRLLFLVNIPIGIVALVLAVRYLEDDEVTGAQRLDWMGWALVSGAVVVIVVGSRQAGDWGWASPGAAALIVAAVATTALALRWLRTIEHPLLDLRVFSVPTFSLVTLLTVLMTVGMYARVAFLPTELQVIHGMTAQRVGVLFMFGAFAIAVAMPVGGWLVDRIGARAPVVVGQVAVAVSVWELAHLSPETSQGRLVAILVGGGLGIGLSITAPMVVGMNALPPGWIGQASTMSSLTRQVSGAIGTSALAAVIIAGAGAVAPRDAAARIGELQGAYNDMFVVAFAVALVTVVLAFGLPGRARSRELRDVASAWSEASEAASGV